MMNGALEQLRNLTQGGQFWPVLVGLVILGGFLCFAGKKFLKALMAVLFCASIAGTIYYLVLFHHYYPWWVIAAVSLLIALLVGFSVKMIAKLSSFLLGAFGAFFLGSFVLSFFSFPSVDHYYLSLLGLTLFGGFLAFFCKDLLTRFLTAYLGAVLMIYSAVLLLYRYGDLSNRDIVSEKGKAVLLVTLIILGFVGLYRQSSKKSSGTA